MSSTEYASLYNGFYNQSQQYTPWAATISNVRSDTITITPYPIKSDPTNADWLDDEINRYRTKLS